MKCLFKVVMQEAAIVNMGDVRFYWYFSFFGGKLIAPLIAIPCVNKANRRLGTTNIIE